MTCMTEWTDLLLTLPGSDSGMAPGSMSWCSDSPPHLCRVSSSISFHWKQKMQWNTWHELIEEWASNFCIRSRGVLGTRIKKFKRKILICSICQFSWYKYFHNAVWLDMDLRKNNNQISGAGTSRLQHISGWLMGMKSCINMRHFSNLVLSKA